MLYSRLGQDCVCRNEETIMTEELRPIGSVELCVESFGSEGNPCVLLMMGAMASMVWWDEAFCRQLAARGHFVIRYDQRDVGRSTCNPPGELTYGVDDLVKDALGVLDSFDINRAHLVGMSLGGMLAQVAALRHPKRVASITAIASGIFDDRQDLPGIDQRILDYHQAGATLDWTDEAAVCEYLVGGWKLLNGSRHPFDEARALALATTEYRRARSLLSMFNHATLAGAEDLYGRVGELTLPTLVIHGDEDPVLPLPHAEALRDAIQGARWLQLTGGGHELHILDWPRILDAVSNLVHDAE